jgi:uncharacterized membrane-anchored protein YhcB (DUF1043 family)
VSNEDWMLIAILSFLLLVLVVYLSYVKRFTKRNVLENKKAYNEYLNAVKVSNESYQTETISLLTQTVDLFKDMKISLTEISKKLDK